MVLVVLGSVYQDLCLSRNGALFVRKTVCYVYIGNDQGEKKERGAQP
jgi:hypothetical protein